MNQIKEVVSEEVVCTCRCESCKDGDCGGCSCIDCDCEGCEC